MYVSAGLSYVPFYRLDIDVASEPLTNAALTLASLARHGQWNNETADYYTKYLAAASADKAVESNSLETLIYASYVMATIQCLYEKSTEDVLVHCSQFCLLVRHNFNPGIPQKKYSWLIALWHAAVRAAYHHYWVQRNLDCFLQVDARALNVKHKELSFQLFRGRIPHASNWRETGLDKLIKVLDISVPFAYTPGPTFDFAKHLHSTLLYLQIYMEQFLFQASANNASTTTCLPSSISLCKCFQRVLHLTERLSPCTTLLDQWHWIYNTVRRTPELAALTASHAPPVFKCRCLQQKLLDPLSIALLYGTSQLFLTLLHDDLDDNHARVLEATDLALTTLLLIWSNRKMVPETTYPALVRRSLLWSGMILYKGRVSLGIGTFY